MFAKFWQNSFTGLSILLFINEGVTKVEAVELFQIFFLFGSSLPSMTTSLISLVFCLGLAQMLLTTSISHDRESQRSLTILMKVPSQSRRPATWQLDFTLLRPLKPDFSPLKPDFSSSFLIFLCIRKGKQGQQRTESW